MKRIFSFFVCIIIIGLLSSGAVAETLVNTPKSIAVDKNQKTPLDSPNQDDRGYWLWLQHYKKPTFKIDKTLNANDYQKIDYKTLLRSAEAYHKTAIKLTGTVWGFFSANKDDAIIVIKVNGKNDQVVMGFAEDFQKWTWDGTKISRFIEGDKVTFYGYVFDIFQGDTYEYVPLFRVVTMSYYPE